MIANNLLCPARCRNRKHWQVVVSATRRHSNPNQRQRQHSRVLICFRTAVTKTTNPKLSRWVPSSLQSISLREAIRPLSSMLFKHNHRHRLRFLRIRKLDSHNSSKHHNRHHSIISRWTSCRYILRQSRPRPTKHSSPPVTRTTRSKGCTQTCTAAL